MLEEIKKTAAFIDAATSSFAPEVGIILGTGLGLSLIHISPEATARRKTTKWKSRRNSIGIRPKSRQKTPGDCVFPENDLIFATEAGTARKNEK